jgi:hypothetical protein
LKQRGKLERVAALMAVKFYGLTMVLTLGTAPWMPAVAGNAKPATPQAMLFQAAEGQIGQRLEVREGKKGGINVSIAVAKPCARREQGRAVLASGEGDPEIETDSEGEGYAVDVFLLKTGKQCVISIRLAVDDRSYAWVRESGCAKRCALSALPMTRQ